MLIEDDNGQLITAGPFEFGPPRGERIKARHDDACRSLLALQSSHTENEAIEYATEIIGAALRGDCYGVMLLRPAQAALYCHASARGGCGHVDMLPLTAQSIVTQVFKSGRSIRLSNARLDPNYYPIDPRIRSEVCVPLRTSTGTIGVVNVESKCLNAFTLDDERWLMTVAAHLAATLERLRC